MPRPESPVFGELPLPKGFRVGGLHCGIKPDPALNDLAGFVADGPATAAGVFTTNRVCGAPVKVSRSRVPSTDARGVIINSGNANACTGERGKDHAERMTEKFAERLGCRPNQVLVCSTGVIGRPLPIERIESAIPELAACLGDTPDHLEAAARGMMTTDTVPKAAARIVGIGGTDVVVCGVAKGAAMIRPNMATMLAVLLTDAALTAQQADRLLRGAVDRSFHCISVEGHRSTSDSVILMASGAAGIEVAADAPDESNLADALTDVCQRLAQAIVADAEGATHFVTIDVRGARSDEEARRIAATIADDVLVKTAVAGADPNWGRIVSCCGRSGIALTEADISIRINGVTVFARGEPAAYDEPALAEHMRKNYDVAIEVELPFGNAAACFWTSDLTQEYVRLNSEYTT
ncbi:MAG: bifunctional glutamate N-acetyltransferase/amino-acid acetyltransferase ArgJ [Planctomycetota bacterium]|nr:MAG: bifunctional glutamate N-acetyltransferase/amino-acid acetyltransferase ArgJ [Planctomycetota bacterium]